MSPSHAIMMFRQFKAGKMCAVPNRKDDVGYFTLITAAEAAEFEHRGCQLL